jgi:hypothetical protein
MATSKNDITGDSLTSRTATQQYRENYDRIFGNRKIQNSEVFGAFAPKVEEDGTVKTPSLRELLDKNPAPVFVHADGSSSNHEPRDYSLMSSINIPSSTPDNSAPIPADDLNLELYNNNTVIVDRVSTKNDTDSAFDIPSYFLHYSDRDIPLVYTGPLLDCPIITVENYCKWYSPYVIMPDGVIRKITSEEISQATDDFSNAWHIDHCFHPRLLSKLAEMLKGEVCEQSLEMAAGRWVMEQMKDPFKFIDPAKYEMPESEDGGPFVTMVNIPSPTAKVAEVIKETEIIVHPNECENTTGDLSVFMKDISPDLEAYSFKKMLAVNSPPPFINPDQ